MSRPPSIPYAVPVPTLRTIPPAVTQIAKPGELTATLSPVALSRLPLPATLHGRITQAVKASPPGSQLKRIARKAAPLFWHESHLLAVASGHAACVEVPHPEAGALAGLIDSELWIDLADPDAWVMARDARKARGEAVPPVDCGNWGIEEFRNMAAARALVTAGALPVKGAYSAATRCALSKVQDLHEGRDEGLTESDFTAIVGAARAAGVISRSPLQTLIKRARDGFTFDDDSRGYRGYWLDHRTFTLHTVTLEVSEAESGIYTGALSAAYQLCDYVRQASKGPGIKASADAWTVLGGRVRALGKTDKALDTIARTVGRRHAGANDLVLSLVRACEALALGARHTFDSLNHAACEVLGKPPGTVEASVIRVTTRMEALERFAARCEVQPFERRISRGAAWRELLLVALDLEQGIDPGADDQNGREDGYRRALGALQAMAQHAPRIAAPADGPTDGRFF